MPLPVSQIKKWETLNKSSAAEQRIFCSQSSIPRCDCGGIVKPDVVLYEERLDADVLEKSVQAIAQADMLLVLGTSLTVYPAAGLIRYYGGAELALCFPTGQGFVGNIGFKAQGQHLCPVETEEILRILQIKAMADNGFRGILKFFMVQSVHTPEVLNSRLRADPCAGQRHHAAASVPRKRMQGHGSPMQNTTGHGTWPAAKAGTGN